MCKVSSRNTRRGRADGARERRRQRRREGPADQCSSSSSSSSQTAHTQLLHPSAGVAPSPLSSPLTLPNAANAAAHATSVGFCITMPSPSSCAVQLVAAPWVRAAAAPLLHSGRLAITQQPRGRPGPRSLCWSRSGSACSGDVRRQTEVDLCFQRMILDTPPFLDRTQFSGRPSPLRQPASEHDTRKFSGYQRTRQKPRAARLRRWRVRAAAAAAGA
jgi:hypothetical protein